MEQVADRDGYDHDLKAFQGLVRTAARRLRDDGWAVGRSGVTLRAASGHWAQVMFQYPVTGFRPVQAQLFAGAVSPYLMRVVNQLDPDKAPPARFVAAHAPVAWGVPVIYVPDATEPAMTIDPERLPFDHPTVTLSVTTASAWLDSTIGLLAPRVLELCSDLAIRDWLLRDARAGSYMDARYAALLTRHLGRLDELPHVLAVAERARAEALQRARAQGLRVGYRDRQTHYPQDWSHERFLRFLDEAPP